MEIIIIKKQLLADSKIGYCCRLSKKGAKGGHLILMICFLIRDPSQTYYPIFVYTSNSFVYLSQGLKNLLQPLYWRSGGLVGPFAYILLPSPAFALNCPLKSIFKDIITLKIYLKASYV